MPVIVILSLNIRVHYRQGEFVALESFGDHMTNNEHSMKCMQMCRCADSGSCMIG